ncbi:PREDICTED: E3 ubiquitin-protein ligase FANCL isoform X2 [Tarenaya hassleriana]|uniref:E3 ubiquitin-protein ligase FANCL isoform X2 n=1 Tax=Tarenaya hassleriana TaxID=28532 RepID=UPI00053C8AC3|nr:PREDICTED: E3 ubiquitin-protein ligase FANCL isoform X2 [Tarenaya hassleriana]
MEYVERGRCRELAKSSSFYRRVYSEIEELGWERLKILGRDLTFFSFHIIDQKGREHILEIQLDKDYPKCPPSVSADIPYMFNLEWTESMRLKDVMRQFQEHLNKLQEFWSVLDDIDKSLCVVDAKQPSRASTVRRIQAGNDCIIIVHVNFNDPKSLPECRFMDPGPPAAMHMDCLRMRWRRNSKKWSKERSFSGNLVCVLDAELPRPHSVQHEADHQQIECGICYAQFLPTDEELGARSGTRTDYICDNTSCNKSFHSLCLIDWLRSITTTRQSFDVLFGNCPYCSDPVAVKIDGTKK